LIFTSAGGAIATPAGFTRAPDAPYGGGTQDVSIWYKTATGLETLVAVTLNGSGDNVGGTIMEFSGSLSYATGSNNGTGVSISSTSDFQVAASGATVSAQSLAIAVFSVGQSTAWSQSNQWRQMGPAGALVRSAGAQDASGFASIFAVGIADIDASHQYPPQASTGHYSATSIYQASGPGTAFACQAIFTDTSGVATVSFANSIVKENSLPGTDNGNWMLGTAGTDATIAGFPTTPSVQPGGTVNFKVGCAFTFRAEIYRLGFYGYDNFGARNVLGNQAGYLTGTVVSQPTPAVDGTLGSTSCAAWTTNVTWSVPSDAVPGVYYVIFRRTDAGNTSKAASTHFVVRESSPSGKMAIVIPDLTHHAYSVWGAITDHGDLSTGTWTGRSLYQTGSDGSSSNIAHRAYAVCLDRPYSVQSTQEPTYIFDSEFGFIQFCEAQGYNLTYLSDMDLEGSSTLLNSAAMVLMVGHHEYWTANIFSAFQNAVAAGVNTFVYSANTAGWRVRFASADTNKRTAICYKDGITRDTSAGWSGTGYDPLTPTGTWRDSGATNGIANPDRRLDNTLTGQRFIGSGPLLAPMQFANTVKTKPIWRNSPAVQALASGTHVTDISNSIGYELDAADGATGQPSNLVIVASTSISVTTGANAAGTVYTTSATLTATWTLYRDGTSGALVFNTGNWRSWWSATRWHGSSPVGSVSIDVINALLAILYDLGGTPHTLTALEPGADTTPTDPATGAPTAGNANVALAYGLTASSTVLGAATLSATGALTATAVDVVSASAALSTTGAIGAAGLAIDLGATALSSTGALGTTGTLGAAGATTLAATPALGAAATRGTGATVVMSSAPGLGAAPIETAVSSAALSSAPALTATATQTSGASAALSSAPALTATATRTALGTVTLATTPTVTATGTQTLTGASVVLSATPVLSAVPMATLGAAATLSAMPALGGTALGSASGVAGLICVPTLTATTVYGAHGTVALATTPAVTAAAVMLAVDSAALSAVGAVSAAASYLGAPTAALSAVGAVSAVAVTQTTATAALACEPAMTTIGTYVAVTTVALSSTATLAAAVTHTAVALAALSSETTLGTVAVNILAALTALASEPVLVGSSVLGVANLACGPVLFVDVFGGAFVADLSVTGVLTASPGTVTTDAADLACEPSISAGTAFLVTGAADLACTAVLIAAAVTVAPGVVTLTSTPALTVAAVRTVSAGMVALSAIGVLVARETEAFLASAPRISVAALRTVFGVVTLSAAPALTAGAFITMRTTVTLSATPTLLITSVAAIRNQQGAAVLLVCAPAVVSAALQTWDTRVILMRSIAVLGANGTHLTLAAIDLSATGTVGAHGQWLINGIVALTVAAALTSAAQRAEFNPVPMSAVGVLHAGALIIRASWPYLFALMPDRWSFQVLEPLGGGD
jgi:hypothetical protein